MSARTRVGMHVFLFGGGCILLLALFLSPTSYGQQSGPVIIPRSRTDPSIHEGPSGQQSAGYKTVLPFLGLVPSSYSWFGNVLGAIGATMGSLYQPFTADPQYLGYKSGQQVGFDFWGAIGWKQNVSRLSTSAKGLGGRNITDTPGLGVIGDPGGPFWVGYPRIGNIENPPRYQIANHHPYDCFCRYDEAVECPLPGPFWHTNWGGPWYNLFPVPCATCFQGRILKHDKFVGTNHGTHGGYPRDFPGDSGYQECLRQSIESYSGSGPGGQPRGGELYGL